MQYVMHIVNFLCVYLSNTTIINVGLLTSLRKLGLLLLAILLSITADL